MRISLQDIFIFIFLFYVIINNGIRLYTDKQTSPSHGTPSREGGGGGGGGGELGGDVAINRRCHATGDG